MRSESPKTDDLQAQKREVDWRVVAAASITVFAWASAFVVIRFVAGDYSPGGLTLGRLLIGTLVLGLFMVRRGFTQLSRRDWGLVTLIGVAWFAIYNVSLNAAEHHLDAGTAAMLIQVAPIIIGALAGFILGEGFPKMLVIGGLIAFAGTMMIGFATSTGDADAVGVLLTLLAATVYAIAMVAQKVVLRRVSAVQVTFLACAIGFVVCLPFAPRLISEVAAAPPIATAGVIYLGLVPTAIAFSTWAYALARTDAGRLGAVTYVVPPITIVLGWVFLDEVPAALAVVGGVISLVGVGLARRTNKTFRTSMAK